MPNLDFNYIQIQNPPLLSVVMPVHNPHEFLSPCLDSVIHQTFKNFEFIAIDDASTDDSYSILKNYESHDNRLQVFKNEQSIGAARTRNRGLQLARGKYIIFLDADDFFELDFFEHMISEIETYDADIAICSILTRDERTKSEILSAGAFSEILRVAKQPFSPDVFNNINISDMPYAPFNKLVRREMLIEKKIQFQNLTNSNDVYFAFMAIAEAEKIVFLSKPYVHYRYNTGAQISTNRHKNPFCICYAFQEIHKELIKRGLWNNLHYMYFNGAVSSIISITQLAKSEEMLSYIRGKGGEGLGLLKLKRYDFLSLQMFARYQRLFYGQNAIIGSKLDTIRFLLFEILKGNILVFSWWIIHYAILLARKVEKIMKG